MFRNILTTVLLFAAGAAAAQSYPSPTFNIVTATKPLMVHIPYSGQNMRWTETGGADSSSTGWNDAPIYFDLTNANNNFGRGLSCTSITVNSATTINKGCIALSVYSPNDNGGDSSALYAKQAGGGNVISSFNLALETATTRFQGYTSGTSLTVTSTTAGQKIYSGYQVWTEIAIASGTYTGSTGAVSLTTATAHGISVGDTFNVSDTVCTGTVCSLMVGNYTAAAGTTGTTLNYTTSITYGSSSITGGYVGKLLTGSTPITISSQASGSGGGVGVYVMSASSTVGSSSSPVTLRGNLPYILNGYGIESQVDGTKHSVFSSAVNGVAFLGVVNGNGTGIYLNQSPTNTAPGSRAFVVRNPANDGDNAYIEMSGAGSFKGLTVLGDILASPLAGYTGTNSVKLQLGDSNNYFKATNGSAADLASYNGICFKSAGAGATTAFCTNFSGQVDVIGAAFFNGSIETRAEVKLVNLPTSGTVRGTLCLDTWNVVYVKTTAGSCL